MAECAGKPTVKRVRIGTNATLLFELTRLSLLLVTIARCNDLLFVVYELFYAAFIILKYFSFLHLILL